MLGFLGWAYALASRLGHAHRILQELKERTQTEYVAPMAFGYIYVGLEQKDQVMEWLEKAYENRDPFLNLLTSSHFDKSRSDPRFQNLLQRMGLVSDPDSDITGED